MGDLRTTDSKGSSCSSTGLLESGLLDCLDFESGVVAVTLSTGLFASDCDSVDSDAAEVVGFLGGLEEGLAGLLKKGFVVELLDV